MWQRLIHYWLDWHLNVEQIGNDGCSFTGQCRVCKRRVLQDSQGNWFAVDRDEPCPE